MLPLRVSSVPWLILVSREADSVDFRKGSGKWSYFSSPFWFLRILEIGEVPQSIKLMLENDSADSCKAGGKRPTFLLLCILFVSFYLRYYAAAW
jgi:hypothetical protein